MRDKGREEELYDNPEKKFADAKYERCVARALKNGANL